MRFIIISILLWSSQCFSAPTLNLIGDVNSWTGQVYLSFIGDSLAAGGGACGPGGHYLPMVTTQACGMPITYSNASIGGYRWTNTWTDQTMQLLTNKHPRVVVAICGRNDMLGIFSVPPAPHQAYPDYWPTSLSAIQAIYTNCRALNASLVLSDILPYYTNGFAIPSENSYDAEYRSFCSTNPGAYYMPCRCFLALPNSGYGPCDSLNPIYYSCTNDSDPLHINRQGYDLWGPIVAAELEAICYRPRAISGARLSGFSSR